MSQSPLFQLKENAEKPNLPLISVNNSATLEETFYGKFRSIVKQRFFGLKLEEEPFMEFLEGNTVLK